MKVLVVEDEPKVSAFIEEGLKASNHEVDVAFDGLAARKAATANKYDVVLLDVIIPEINGFDVCRLIRAEQPDTPILMLTALGTTEDKLTGFEAGADDYMVKPFEFKELLARLNALTRRTAAKTLAPNSLKAGDLELDMNERVAIRAGKKIELTAKEFSLLEYFMRNKGRVLSRADIVEKVWDLNFDTGTNTVDVYINLLRKKIDKDFDTKLLHTKIGMGYMFKEE